MAKKEKKADRWEVRKGRKVWLASPIPFCGYDEQIKASLKKKGFRFYCNGKAAD